MRAFVGFLFLAAAVAFVCADDKKDTNAGKKFTTRYDNVNIEDILKSDRLLNNYFDCLMDKKACTPDGQELKKAIPLALKTDCAGCSEKQKVGAEKVITYVVENKPDHWKKLEEKYDPTGIYRSKHADLAKKKGVKI